MVESVGILQNTPVKHPRLPRPRSGCHRLTPVKHVNQSNMSITFRRLTPAKPIGSRKDKKCAYSITAHF